MATIKPAVFSGVFYPKNKMDKPMPGTFVGNICTGDGEVTEPPETELPPTTPNAPKPPPEDGGWGWSERTGWIYKPGPGDPQPKR